MKKLLALLLCCLLLLAGCAAGGSDSAGGGAPEGTVAGPTGSPDTAGNDPAGPSDSQDTADADPAGAGPLREISLVLDWYPNALHSFIYTAMEKGYYAQEGLKVNICFPSGINDALSLVAAGQADIGLYYQPDIILARQNHQVPVKSIGAVLQGPLNVVLSLEKENIRSPRDLAGKAVGYSGTELSEAMIRSMLKSDGGDSEDVRLVDVGFDLMSAMTTGQVNATIDCMLNHEVPQLEEEGFKVNYFSPADYGVPGYYDGVFLANDQTVAQDSAMLAGFLRASARGFADTQAAPQEALDILLAHQNAENFPLSPDVESQSLSILLPLMENSGASFLSQSDAVWQETADWLLAEGLIKEVPALDEVRVNLDWRK